jgi:hypothetical protein
MKTLDESLVRQYVEVNSQASKLQADREALRVQIIEAMRAGARCPKGGPFIVELEVQQRRAISWKDIAEALAKKFKARKVLARMVAEAPENEVTALRVHPNPDWKGGK